MQLENLEVMLPSMLDFSEDYINNLSFLIEVTW